MHCSICREILSARLDGEASPEEVAAAAVHLASCSACAHQRDEFEKLHRIVRLSPAEAVPDLTARIITAAAPRPVQAQTTPVWRAGLALVALAQLLAAASHLGGDHVLRDQAAWEAALAAGYAWAAWRPDRSTGLLPVSAVLTVLLLANGSGDLGAGATHHLLAPIGLLLVVLASSAPRLRALAA